MADKFRIMQVMSTKGLLFLPNAGKETVFAEYYTFEDASKIALDLTRSALMHNNPGRYYVAPCDMEVG